MAKKKQLSYDFCPRCGAVVRDNVCMSCGLHVNEVKDEESPDTAGETADSIYVARKRKQIAAVVAIVLTFVLLIFLLAVLVFQSAKDLNINWKGLLDSAEYDESLSPGQNLEENEDFNYSEEDKEYDELEDEYAALMLGETTEYGYTAEDYQKIGEQTYYEWPDNAIRKDLDYTVEIESIYENDDELGGYCSCFLPVLNGNIPNIDSLNGEIYEIYEQEYEFYVKQKSDGKQVQSTLDGILTYMGENYASMVFLDSRFVEGELSVQALKCVNIDIKNGVIMNNIDMLDADSGFISAFVERSNNQNGLNGFLDSSDEETLKRMFEDENLRIIYFTPIGTELGLNYDGGSITATFKEYRDFMD